MRVCCVDEIAADRRSRTCTGSIAWRIAPTPVMCRPTRECSEVALGVIRTPMHDPVSYETLAKLHPVGRLGEVDDVVDAVVYLENAGFVTGEILHVDGGQSAGH